MCGATYVAIVRSGVRDDVDDRNRCSEAARLLKARNESNRIESNRIECRQHRKPNPAERTVDWNARCCDGYEGCAMHRTDEPRLRAAYPSG
jgi:hypothetical protein